MEPVDPVQSTLKQRHLLTLLRTMDTTFVVRDMWTAISFIPHRFIATLSLGHAVAWARTLVFSELLKLHGHASVPENEQGMAPANLPPSANSPALA